MAPAAYCAAWADALPVLALRQPILAARCAAELTLGPESAGACFREAAASASELDRFGWQSRPGWAPSRPMRWKFLTFGNESLASPRMAGNTSRRSLCTLLSERAKFCPASRPLAKRCSDPKLGLTHSHPKRGRRHLNAQPHAHCPTAPLTPAFAARGPALRTGCRPPWVRRAGSTGRSRARMPTQRSPRTPGPRARTRMDPCCP